MGLPLDQTLDSAILVFMFRLEDQLKLKRSSISPLLLPLSTYFLDYHLYVSSLALTVHPPRLIEGNGTTIVFVGSLNA